MVVALLSRVGARRACPFFCVVFRQRNLHKTKVKKKERRRTDPFEGLTIFHLMKATFESPFFLSLEDIWNSPGIPMVYWRNLDPMTSTPIHWIWLFLETPRGRDSDQISGLSQGKKKKAGTRHPSIQWLAGHKKLARQTHIKFVWVISILISNRLFTNLLL